MYTAGEIISTALRVYVNPGANNVDDDAELRFRAAVGLRSVMAAAETLAPYWWRHADGTVSLGAGDGFGSLPGNFGSFGYEGQVYISGQNLPELEWVQPEAIEALRIATSLAAPFPRNYTLKGKTSLGLSQIQVWPTNPGAVTLAVKNYRIRVPYPIDYPSAPSAVAGAAGNLNGDYTWKLTNVTADGETEAGAVSASVSLTSTAATVTIPVSESRYVTSRKLYRTIASGTAWLLVATISDNTTVTYTDDVADGSLGDAAPAITAAVSGTEAFPEDFHELVLLDGTVTKLMSSQGDLRDAGMTQAWKSMVRRMWAEQKQGQNRPEGMVPYGLGSLPHGRRVRLLDA
jgi:hypothetical protein